MSRPRGPDDVRKVCRTQPPPRNLLEASETPAERGTHGERVQLLQPTGRCVRHRPRERDTGGSQLNLMPSDRSKNPLNEDLREGSPAGMNTTLVYTAQGVIESTVNTSGDDVSDQIRMLDQEDVSDEIWTGFGLRLAVPDEVWCAPQLLDPARN